MVNMAPTDGAALKTPKPSLPTHKISCAKIGSKITAPPNRTEIISSVNAPRIALVLNTKLKPSFKLCKIGSLTLVFKIGFLEIKKTVKNDNTTRLKTIHKDQCTPNQLIANPEKASPTTDAICQAELLQVAALG